MAAFLERLEQFCPLTYSTEVCFENVWNVLENFVKIDQSVGSLSRSLDCYSLIQIHSLAQKILYSCLSSWMRYNYLYSF